MSDDDRWRAAVDLYRDHFARLDELYETAEPDMHQRVEAIRERHNGQPLPGTRRKRDLDY